MQVQLPSDQTCEKEVRTERGREKGRKGNEHQMDDRAGSRERNQRKKKRKREEEKKIKKLEKKSRP